MENEHRVFKEKNMDGKFSGILKHVGHCIEHMTTDPYGMGKDAFGHVREALGRYEKAVTERDGAQGRDWGRIEVNDIRRTCDVLEERRRPENRKEDLAHISNRWLCLRKKAIKLDHDV